MWLREELRSEGKANISVRSVDVLLMHKPRSSALVHAMLLNFETFRPHCLGSTSALHPS